jgi:SAM-dependent methyltransferase
MRKDLFTLHAELEERHWWFLARRRILASLAEAVVAPDQSRLVIDVGCGTGANLASLASRYACIGVDASPEAIALARERFPETRFVLGTAPNDLGEEVARADLVLMMDVLEHLDDDRGTLSRLIAALSPGANLLITVPADPTLWSEHDVSFGHRRRYTLEGLEALWQGLPVSVRLRSHFNARLYPAAKAMRSLAARRGRAAGRYGTDFSMPPPPLNAALTRIFAGEAGRLCAALDATDGTRPLPYRRGLSATAILHREP